MEKSKPAFEKYIFVCENLRAGRPCCGHAGEKIRERLKQIVQDKGLAAKIRVSRTGCLDTCSQGPNVLVMPDGVWFKMVSEKELEQIVEQVGGKT